MNSPQLDKSAVVDFLVKSGALRFGDFTLKSGRKAPYFINTGGFDTGIKISELGDFYARKLISLGLDNVDAVFGPAYKGVPLCVATAISLSTQFGKEIGFSFNRKEAKTRGEGGEFVGKPLAAGMKVVVVEDVVTAGTTLQEIIPLLRDKVGVSIEGVVILVDRCERGTLSPGERATLQPGERATLQCSAVQEAETQHNIKVHPIVTVHDIISHLSKPNSSGIELSSDQLVRIEGYLQEFGAK